MTYQRLKVEKVVQICKFSLVFLLLRKKVVSLQSEKLAFLYGYLIDQSRSGFRFKGCVSLEI